MPEEKKQNQLRNGYHWREGKEESKKSWLEGVQVDMKTRNLEPDQFRNRGEWRLVSGRRRQLL